MPRCQQLKRRHRKPCIGDMDTMIKLQNRNIAEPVFGSPDYDETFDGDSTVWAQVNTVSGKTFFDGVNSDINITHQIIINYDAAVTAETWIELNSSRIDILMVEDLEVRHEFMLLTCAERGSNVFEATKA